MIVGKLQNCFNTQNLTNQIPSGLFVSFIFSLAPTFERKHYKTREQSPTIVPTSLLCGFHPSVPRDALYTEVFSLILYTLSSWNDSTHDLFQLLEASHYGRFLIYPDHSNAVESEAVEIISPWGNEPQSCKVWVVVFPWRPLYLVVFPSD